MSAEFKMKIPYSFVIFDIGANMETSVTRKLPVVRLNYGTITSHLLYIEALSKLLLYK